MRRGSAPVRCVLEGRLGDSPAKNSAVVWPKPIDVRLTYLVAVASGARTKRVSRRFLLAAIVLAVRPDAEAVGGSLRRLRNARVGHCLPRSVERDRSTDGDWLSDAPQKPAGVVWPLAIDHRVDELIVMLDRERGESAFRKEVVAAAVLATRPRRGELLEMLSRYDTATVRDALIDPPEEAQVEVTLPHHRPGRRNPARDARAPRPAPRAT